MAQDQMKNGFKGADMEQVFNLLGFDVPEVASYIHYKGSKGIPPQQLRDWFKLPLKDNKDKFKAITNALITIMNKEHRR